MDNRMELRDLLEIIPGFPKRTLPVRTPDNDPMYNDRRAEAMRWADEQLEAANMLGTREGEAMRARLVQQRMRELAGE